MRTGRPRSFELILSPEDRATLERYAAARSLPHGLVRRARIILLSAGGVANATIAARLGLTAPAVSHWRRRYRTQGLAGLYDALRSGRPRQHDDERVARLLRTVLRSAPPDGGTHWSVRTVAAKTRISKSTVQRYVALFGEQPHRTRASSCRPIPSSSRRSATSSASI